MRRTEELVVTFRPRAKRPWLVRRQRERIRLTDDQVTALVRIVAQHRTDTGQDEPAVHTVRFNESGQEVLRTYNGRSVW